MSKIDLMNVIQKGKYYYPAFRHYSQFSFANVICDYCNKSNLNSCIGYENKDLCLNCIEHFTNNMEKVSQTIKFEDMIKPNQQIKTKMMQDSVRKNNNQNIHTYMMQDSVRNNNDGKIYTNMMQDSVRNSDYDSDDHTFMMQDSVRNYNDIKAYNA